jgi:TusA-related sulfurtransferase
MGTTSYGYWLVPTVGAGIGWYRTKDRISRKAVINAFWDGLAAVVVVFLLVFLYEFCWNVPRQIWRGSNSLGAPSFRFPAPKAPILDIPPPHQAPKERARLRITNYQMAIEDRNFITVNIFLKNVGAISADAKIYNASSLLVMADDPATEKRLEAQAEDQMRHILVDLHKGSTRPTVHTITPNSPEIWFTQIPGVKLTEKEFADFKGGRIKVFFSGLIEYADKGGTHRTYYCVSNNGNAQVIFLCGIAGET